MRSLGDRSERLAPYFLIGHISVAINFRGGGPVLAGLYSIALIQCIILPPMLVAKPGRRRG